MHSRWRRRQSVYSSDHLMGGRVGETDLYSSATFRSWYISEKVMCWWPLTNAHYTVSSCHATKRWRGSHYSPITAPRGLNKENGLKVVDGLMKLREAQVRPDMALSSPFHRTSTLYMCMWIWALVYASLVCCVHLLCMCMSVGMCEVCVIKTISVRDVPQPQRPQAAAGLTA